MKWRKIELAECCISIADGDHQPPPKADAGIPFVTISNIKNNSIDFRNCMHVPQAYYDSLHEKRKAQKDDILYSVVGSFGIPVLMKENTKFVFQRHIAILRPDKSVINPAFMYYAMFNRDFYLQADAAAIGAAQRTISLGSLQKLIISLPDMLTQKHIASILSAYDDLIENNRRQIKLLEEAAQRLYREWFVELRFPGHEGVKIVDGVPEGWKKYSFGDICKVKKDTVTPDELEKYLPYIGLEHIPRNDFCLMNWGTSDGVTSNKFKFSKGDILFGKIRPYFHKVGFTICDGVCSTDTIVMTASEELYSLLLMVASSKEFVDYTYQTCKEGAKMPRADWNTMKVYPVLMATKPIMREFNRNIQAIQDKCTAIALQIRSLHEARELLLPKLMSGEMSNEKND